MPFQKGQVANPKGRPKGAKHKLSEAFFRKLQQDWKENGMSAIQEAREKNPMEYLKMIATLVPKEAHVTGKIDHQHTHDGLPETDGFIEGVFSVGETAPSEESGEVRPLLPH